jgi:hypothetical protein
MQKIIVILLAPSNHLPFAQIPGVINTPLSSPGTEQQQPTPSAQNNTMANSREVPSSQTAESTKSFINYKDPRNNPIISI